MNLRTEPPVEPIHTLSMDDVSAIGAVSAVPSILKTVCELTGLRFATVARVTEQSWTACAVYDDLGFGLVAGDQLDIRTTLCDTVQRTRKPIVIDDAKSDPTYHGHRTPAMYGFRSYMSVPIFRPDGSLFGTICALDPVPAELKSPKILRTVTLFAELIGSQLAAERRFAEQRSALRSERETADLREQFIAVLGHDLRNPLASIGAGINLLRKRSLDDRGAMIAGQMQSSVSRMGRLIDDVLDFARGRLGGGIAVSHGMVGDLGQALEEVVVEARTSHPEREIAVSIDIARPMRCDSGRIAQVLSNLIGNALQHGSPDSTVTVTAKADLTNFSMSVANNGPTLPAEIMDRLFHPFTRLDQNGPAKGLGLGLYISSEIARAHNGRLSAVSRDGRTVFTFEMPLYGD